MFDTTVWIAQGFLAVFFLLAGLPKIVGRGLDRWVGFDQIPRAMTLLIGGCEIAAGVGLVVPMLANRGEWATPLAAIGVATISLMAGGFHLRNHEWLPMVETVFWASLAGSIAAARWEHFSTGPAVSRDEVLPPLVIGLVVVLMVNLVVLLRRPAGRYLPGTEGAR